MIYDWSEERIKNAVAVSCSFQETLRNLSIPTQGNNVSTLKRKIEKYNVDISHFTFSKASMSPKKNIDAYLSNSIYITSSKLKTRLIKEGIKEYKCENCGNIEWMGKQIPLELHHINGNNNDNSLENLQLLCPNCHAQTDTYCKNKKAKELRYCEKCGRQLKSRTATLCPRCSAENRGKCLLSDNEIIEMIKNKSSNTQIAMKAGVSESAIRKKRKKLGL